MNCDTLSEPRTASHIKNCATTLAMPRMIRKLWKKADGQLSLPCCFREIMWTKAGNKNTKASPQMAPEYLQRQTEETTVNAVGWCRNLKVSRQRAQLFQSRWMLLPKPLVREESSACTWFFAVVKWMLEIVLPFKQLNVVVCYKMVALTEAYMGYN